MPALSPSSALLQAQTQAKALFAAVEAGGLIVAGNNEADLSEAIYALAKAQFGISKHWHKRIVRSGPNTLCGYPANPANRTFEADDILFLDFGPVFEEWEADFGKTYVLGHCPKKHRLAQATEAGFAAGQAFYKSQPHVPAQVLFEWMKCWAQAQGYQLGAPHVGHLVGAFPHERLLGDEVSLYLHPNNPLPLNHPDSLGNPRHWVLEVHLVDPELNLAAFYEDLLNVSN
jgi:Xaa-Pro aminopeptidase